MPCLIYFHGGGFGYKASPFHKKKAAIYAKYANIKVVFPDYHLLPKYTYKEIREDAINTYKWVITNYEKLGINKEKIKPLIFFSIQLILNIIWSPVFFGLEKIRTAMIIILGIWMFLLITIITFYKHSKIASILLIPYFIWTTFAVYLNFGILRLNSQA